MRRRLLFVILLGIFARVLAWYVIGDDRVPWLYEFEEIANNLVEYKQYAFSFYGLAPRTTTSFIPPVYPLFLAIIQKWAPTSDLLIKGFQIFLSSLTIITLYSLVQEVGGTKGQALLASFFLAIYPPAIAFSVSVGTTIFETFFVTIGVWLILRSVRKKKNSLMLLAGIAFSLATLTRSPWVVLVPLSIIWLLIYYRRNMKDMIIACTLLILATIGTLSPWIIFNYQTHGKIIITSTNGGLNFWIGNNSAATGEYLHPTQLDPSIIEEVTDWTEIERDRYFYQQGFEFIQDSPQQFIQLTAKKLLYFVFFRPNIGSNYEGASLPLQAARLSFIAAWVIYLPFALIGLANLGKNRAAHFLPIIFFISQAIVSSVYFTGTRFRTPLDGFVLLWAALGFSSIQKWLQNRRYSAT